MKKNKRQRKKKARIIHRILFTDLREEECVARAKMMHSTAAIAAATGLSLGQVQYRISKAKVNRWDERNCRTEFSRAMFEQNYTLAQQFVRNEIVPKFA